MRDGGRPPRSGPLHELLLALNLTDPDAPGFKASRCRSIREARRFMHEMSVRAMFTFGDRWRKEGGVRARRYGARMVSFAREFMDTERMIVDRRLLPAR